jgi:hypothetical protein
VLAGSYPALLQSRHGQYLAHGITLSALLALVGAYVVPVAGFCAGVAFGRVPQPSGRTVLLFRLSLIMVATPPAFTLVGVVLYLMKITGADTGVWVALCAIIGVGTILRYLTLDLKAPPAAPEAPARPGRLRYSHGVVTALLWVGFIAAHLFNHLVALEGAAAHGAVLHALRQVYRNRWVEPARLVLLAFQLLSGLMLWQPKTRKATDLLGTLQSASGIYLAVYLASHVNAVFVLARHFGIETDWGWATGAPVGILHDAWDIRLLPHYSLAVFLVLAHLSCGLRAILMAHGACATGHAAGHPGGSHSARTGVRSGHRIGPSARGLSSDECAPGAEGDGAAVTRLDGLAGRMRVAAPPICHRTA